MILLIIIKLKHQSIFDIDKNWKLQISYLIIRDFISWANR